MATNIGTLMSESVSPFIKNRSKTLGIGAALGVVGAASVVGGSMYNRQKGGMTLGGGAAEVAGVASMAFGARAAGLGRLMTAGGMQRMGNRLQNAASRTVLSAEGKLGKTGMMLDHLATGFYGGADMLSNAAESIYNAKPNPIRYKYGYGAYTRLKNGYL